jgi:hypothetical protein
MTFVVHTSGPVKIGTAVIAGCTNISCQIGNTVRGEASSGEILTRVVALYAQKFSAGFSTEDLKAALEACGPMGSSLAAGNLVLFGSKLADGGSLASGSTHASATAATGVVAPRSLNCAHQGDATISYEAMISAASDVTDPVVLSLVAALPAIAGVTKWALKTLTIGGVSVEQGLSVSVDFGLRIEGESGGGSIRDRVVAIRGVQPRLTISSNKIANVLSNLKGASGAFSIVLQQRIDGGSYGPATITLSGTALALQEQLLSVSGQGLGQVALSGHVQYDGTHDPITYSYDDGVAGP